MSLVKVYSENLPLKDYSAFDSPRYNCVLFLSLFKLNGESVAAKNVLFMSLVKVNSENLPLNDCTSFESPRYECVLFLSLNGEVFRCEKLRAIFHKTNLPSSKAGLRPAFSSGCVGKSFTSQLLMIKKVIKVLGGSLLTFIQCALST